MNPKNIDGSILSEEELKEMQKPVEINYPMPGEVPSEEDEEKHSHSMPAVTFIQEDGSEL